MLNLGIPGYSTAENLIQTAFELPELHPSVALYYEGWNDVRSAHVPNLDPYYADFHGRLQPTNVGLAGPHGYYSALWYGCSVIAARLFASQPFSPADSSIDVPALDLFDRNLRAIVAIDRGFQIEPVLIPQAANCAALRDVSFGTPWIPFVPEREQCAVLAAYNDRMLTIGRELGVTVVTAVAVPDAFSMDDFNDLVHFNQKGARKFSELVAPVVRQMLSR
ncbi:MAG: hypothetical protein HY270_01835 [Deltaproteobacteria bacterium]|nr:hypothetical protein [Deltaproteobacteria bacterium]